MSLLNTIDILQQILAFSTFSATRKFHDYSVPMPNVNAHHLCFNNNDITA